MRFTVSPDTKYIFYPNQERSIIIYDLLTGHKVKELCQGHFDHIICCETHPIMEEGDLFTGSDDTSILVWSPFERKRAVMNDNDNRSIQDNWDSD